jgi:hypothetical protein
MYVSVDLPQISAGLAAVTVTMLIPVARNTSVSVCRTGGRGMALFDQRWLIHLAT